MKLILPDKKSLWLMILTIVFIGLMIYCPQSRMDFVLDDHYVIVRNPTIKHPSVSGIFGSGLFEAAHRELGSGLNYYRPLLSASLAVDYKLWGLNPFFYRWTNLVIHIFNGVLVFIFLYAMFGDLSLAALGSVFFVILPVHEWSVRYIVGRGDLLSAFFTLGLLLSLVIYIRKGLKLWLWVGAACFLCALLSKEVALLNVAYVILVSWYVNRDIKRTMAITTFFFIIAATYYFLRLELLPINTGAGFDVVSILQGIGVGLSYLLRFWLPASLMASVPQGEWLAVFSLVSFLTLIYGYSIRKKKLEQNDLKMTGGCGFALIWIAVGMLQFIVAQRIIGRLGPVLSEHFLYLESVGFVLILAHALENLRFNVLGKVLSVAFISYCVFISMSNGKYWVSEEALLRHVQSLEQREFTVAYEQLAMRYDEDPSKVFKLMDRSVNQNMPDLSLWYRRMGDIYRKKGDYDNAKNALASAVRLNARNYEAHNELAVCFLETGDSFTGVSILENSIEMNPNQSDANRLLGIYYYRNGNYQKSIIHLSRALFIDPDALEAHLHVMMDYYFSNDQKAYLQTVDAISRRFKDPKTVLSFVAHELYSHGHFQEVVKIITQSRDLFRSEPDMLLLVHSARARISNLPK